MQQVFFAETAELDGQRPDLSYWRSMSGLQTRFHNLPFLFFTVGIGVLAAVGALFFRSLIDLFQSLFWASGTTFLDKLVASPWWVKLLVPVAGGLVAGPVILYLVPEARGPGVPEVIAAVANSQSIIRHRVTFLKALVTSLLIGSGASVGREGPIVQIGGSIGSSLAQLFKLSTDMRRVCVASGAAAGIAATFNAPIAGTLFALEIILLDIELAYISHIIIASVIASVLSRLFWGDFPAFVTAPFQLVHYWELGLHLIVGIAAGFLSIAFVRLIYATDGVFRRIPITEWAKPGIAGLFLGGLALYLPHALGVGYDSVNLSLTNALPLKLTLVLLVAKVLATSLCIGSGMSGGIFAPSLVIGASLGTAMALVANALLPDLALTPSYYAMAGMGAVVAGTTLAPITAIVTIFEVTAYNEQIILPLMVACISSVIIVRIFFGYSAYEMKLIKQGISIVRGHDVGILRDLLVQDFMSRHFESVRHSTGLQELVDRFIQSPYPHFVVLDEKGGLAGVLSLRDLKASLDKYEELKHLVIAADLMTAQVLTLSPHDNLEKALDLFERHHISLVPIVEPSRPKRVIGVLKKDDLLQAYRERVLKDRILSTPIR